MGFSVVVLLSLAVTLSLQACPQGWRQSTYDPNKCYLVVVNKKIWFEAGAFCSNAAPNAFLTSIQSAFETYSLNAIVTDTPSISSCDQIWIGANDFDQSGQFVWTDGRPFQYANWGPDEPDLSNQCVSSQARTTGKWKTEPCGTENCFVCDMYMNSSGSTTITTPSPASTTPTMSTTVTTSTQQFTTTRTQSPMTSSSSMGTNMTDCYDWLYIGGATTDGIYPINPSGRDQFNVYCDMTTNGGGWTLFQKRSDESLVFLTKTWQEYKNGFNNGLQRNHWLGLDRLHILSTKDATVTLRIDLHGDRCKDNSLEDCNPLFNPNENWWGEYQFSIGDEASKYQLHTSQIQAGNLTVKEHSDGSFSYHNGGLFSTIDQDNSGNDCEKRFQSGGWWDINCFNCALNGKYNANNGYLGFFCFSWQNTPSKYEVVPVVSEMKLRRG